MTDIGSLDALPELDAQEVLRVEVGSTLHGIGIGSDDLDLMSVAIEPRRSITGLGQWEHFIWRSAPEGERSGPDDVDWVVYGLRKYLRLAIKGNPSILALLYAPESMLHVPHDAGRELLDRRDLIVSQNCIPRFLGYLHGQRKRALDGTGSGHGNREGRREKWASHMVRLGYQALEMATEGGMTLPMPNGQAEVCRAIKRGEVSFEEALDLAADLEGQVRDVDVTPLRKEPDIDAIEDWLHTAYGRAYWL